MGEREEEEKKNGLGNFTSKNHLSVMKFDVLDRELSYPALLGFNFWYIYYCRLREPSDGYNRLYHLMAEWEHLYSPICPVISVGNVEWFDELW